MEHLLSLDLLSETVNQPASTQRETPLKIAIDMADAKVVDRLIALGAKVENECGHVTSALCYALSLLHDSIHRDNPVQEQAYFLGKTRADVYDAKDGAVLDVDLSARRQFFLAQKYESRRNQKIFDGVKRYYMRPPEDHRLVIKVLLHNGADANRRYKVDPRDFNEWTPTLFAAEIGDIEVFKMLVENHGDPELTLQDSNEFERYDALWVATAYGRSSIVTYLMRNFSTSLI
jgi:ankyrin repeat protein